MTSRGSPADAAVFLHSPSGGGAQRRTVTLVNELARRGLAIELWMVTAEGPLEREIDARVRVVELTRWRGAHPLARLPRRVQLLLAMPLLARRLRRTPPRVLLSAASHVHAPALLARRLAGSDVPVVLRISNHLTRDRGDGSPPAKRPLARLLARRLYFDAGAVIAVSAGVGDDLARATGYPRERIVTIYNPIPADALRRRACEPLAHPWFAPGEPPVVLAAGRLVRQKDYPTLLRAFAKVRAVRETRLVILGRANRPKRLAALKALARELGIETDVDFAGYVREPAPYFAAAAVLALSSAWEGLPGVLIEAMACGCPVASTDCPSGPREILDGGRYGPLVPVGDADALAVAILSVLERPPPRGLLAARADEFGVSRAVDRYLEVLRRAAGATASLEATDAPTAVATGGAR